MSIERIMPVRSVCLRRPRRAGKLGPAPASTGILLCCCVCASGPAVAEAPCTLGTIVCENRLPGTPPEVWEIEGAGDPSIQGFATDISVDRGERVDFKIDTAALSYGIDIYRIGYYQGHGARHVARVEPLRAGPLDQPACLRDEDTGLVDCGNWSVTASWQVPSDAVSGVYIARVARNGTGGASHVWFIVRDDDARSGVLVQVADATWQAYDSYGGHSLYRGEPAGRAYKVSYNRPFDTAGNEFRRTFFWTTAYPMIRWLERNGYDVSYFTGVDSARRGDRIGKHRVFLSLGHDEYWSAEQRDAVTAARDAGVHLAFITGNTMFWKTRWERSTDPSRTPFRTLVTYKETHENAKIDPSPTSTGTWRDPRFGSLDGSGVPENALTGTLFVINCCRFDDVVVSAEEGRRRFWRNTALAHLKDGESMTVGRGIVGGEWDTDLDNGYRPPGLMRLSTTETSRDDPPSILLDYGSSYSEGPEHFVAYRHHLTFYRHASGALVFSAASMNFAWAFDAVHADPDDARAPADPDIQQALVNLFADMGVQPATLQPDLVPASPSTDVVAPTVSIDEPVPLTPHKRFGRIRVSGTASDAGGVPAAVEVSIDDGATWHPATGAERWHYVFTPTSAEHDAVLVRAVDDSGNIQPTPAKARITINGIVPHTLLKPALPAALAALLLMATLAVRRRFKPGLRSRDAIR